MRLRPLEPPALQGLIELAAVQGPPGPLRTAVRTLSSIDADAALAACMMSCEALELLTVVELLRTEDEGVSAASLVQRLAAAYPQSRLARALRDWLDDATSAASTRAACAELLSRVAVGEAPWADALLGAHELAGVNVPVAGCARATDGPEEERPTAGPRDRERHDTIRSAAARFRTARDSALPGDASDATLVAWEGLSVAYELQGRSAAAVGCLRELLRLCGQRREARTTLKTAATSPAAQPAADDAQHNAPSQQPSPPAPAPPPAPPLRLGFITTAWPADPRQTQALLAASAALLPVADAAWSHLHCRLGNLLMVLITARVAGTRDDGRDGDHEEAQGMCTEAAALYATAVRAWPGGVPALEGRARTHVVEARFNLASGDVGRPALELAAAARLLRRAREASVHPSRDLLWLQIGVLEAIAELPPMAQRLIVVTHDPDDYLIRNAAATDPADAAADAAAALAAVRATAHARRRAACALVHAYPSDWDAWCILGYECTTPPPLLASEARQDGRLSSAVMSANLPSAVLGTRAPLPAPVAPPSHAPAASCGRAILKMLIRTSHAPTGARDGAVCVSRAQLSARRGS